MAIVQDAKNFLEDTDSSPVKPRRRRALPEASKPPFEEAEPELSPRFADYGRVHSAASVATTAAMTPGNGSRPGSFLDFGLPSMLPSTSGSRGSRLPALAPRNLGGLLRGSSRSSCSSAGTFGGGSAGISAPPTRGDYDPLTVPGELPSPPRTDPPRQRLQLRRNYEHAKVQPHSPLPLPPYLSTKSGDLLLHGASGDDFEGLLDQGDDDFDDLAHFENYQGSGDLSRGFTPIRTQQAPLWSPADADIAEEAYDNSPIRAVASTASARKDSADESPDLHQIWASKDGKWLPESHEQVASSQLSQGSSKCSKGRLHTSQNEDSADLELPSGFLKASSDCDYWDNLSHVGDLNDSVDGRRRDAQTPSVLSSSLSTSKNFDEADEQRTSREMAAAGIVKGATFTWVRGELVGRGSLGTVWKALNRQTGQMMAVKEVAIDQKDSTEIKFRESLQNEIDLYKDLQHPHIVSYLGNDFVQGRLYIYLEYMSGGSIAQVLSQFGPLEETLMRRYLGDLAKGLDYLHTRDPPVLHRDIKGANILVGLDRTVKLSDFGCSKRSGATAIHTLRGSVPWMAPEVMRQSGYGRKADIWSLGCVLIEMSTASPPWGRFDNCLAAMVRIAMSEETPPVPEHLSPACREIIGSCTRRSPEERPSAAQLWDYDFLRGSGDDLSAADESWFN